MTNKAKYKDLCENHYIPLFSQYWWMETVCSDSSWDVFLYEEKNQIMASMPYYLNKKNGFRRIIQPLLTQTNGIWINYPTNQSPQDKYSLEEKACEYFIHQISTHNLSYFQQSFHQSFTNWLPFYWSGFEQTTRYSYVIEDISDITKVEENFSSAKRKHIKKAANLKLISETSAEQFYEHHRQSLAVKGQKIGYSLALFAKLVESARNRNQGEIIALGDEAGIIYAALFIVWDERSAYNLISTIDLKYKDTGASTRVVLEAIRFVSNKTKAFDFEGSMIKNVENSFRQFGTLQKQYFQIQKTDSLLYSLSQHIKNLVR